MSPPRIVLVLASLGLLGHAVGVGAFTTPLCFTALVVYALRAILGGGVMQSCQLCGAKIWEPLGGGEEIRLGRHRISGEKIFLSGPDSDYVQCVNCKSIALKSQVESLLIDTPYVPPPDPLPDEPQTRLERLVVALLRANSRFKAAYGTTTDEYVTWTMATARALDAALEPEGTVSPDG